ncbi:MAG TPA: hypothetical protein VEO01_22865, partial [Pseudonocardiaceae bacterium]|nr:hypothetical protein [Pseudonocardiaceae bacterium]
NCTPAYYRAVRAAGLGAIGVVEHDQHDAELGAATGASYAQAGLADMAAQGAVGIPLGVTADEHLTAGQIPTAVAFQAAASQVIRAASREAMGYGFQEFIHALRARGLVDIEWQAGSLSLVDSLTHFWQDNTGTETVGLVIVDRDWRRRPLPGGDMSFDLTTQLPDPASVAGTGTVQEALATALYGIGGKRNGGALANAVASIQTQLTAIQGALTQEEADLLAAVKGVTAGAVDVKTFAAALAPILAPILAPLLPAGATPAEFIAALDAQLGK